MDSLAQNVDHPYENLPFWRKKRYLIVFLGFIGFFNVYALRVNLSVAIVKMTENRTIEHEDGSITYEQEFAWDSVQKGLVLSSFFYGYITTQLVGGWLGLRFGGNKMFGFGLGITAFLTLLTPLAAKLNFYTLLVIRIVEGIFEGITYPCMYDVWSKWVPPLERSRMVGFVFSGSYFGTVIALPLSGLASVHIGWESVFYIFGGFGLLSSVAWMLLVKKSPHEDKLMSDEERNYILSCLKDQSQDSVTFSEIPWKAIVTSKAVWEALDYDLASSSFLSALPYLTLSILIFVSASLADWVQIKGYLSTTQVRKYFNCGSFVVQVVFTSLVAVFLHPTYTIVFLTIGVGIGAFSISGFSVNHLDIAPRFAPITMGISNTFGSLPGIVSPLLTGFIVSTPTEPDEWKYIFYITAGVQVLGCLFYWFFASGKLQPWAVKKNFQKEKKIPE